MCSCTVDQMLCATCATHQWLSQVHSLQSCYKPSSTIYNWGCTCTIIHHSYPPLAICSGKLDVSSSLKAQLCVQYVVQGCGPLLPLLCFLEKETTCSDKQTQHFHTVKQNIISIFIEATQIYSYNFGTHVHNNLELSLFFFEQRQLIQHNQMVTLVQINFTKQSRIPSKLMLLSTLVVPEYLVHQIWI